MSETSTPRTPLPDMSHLDPVDRREVERFMDYLREADEIRRRGNPEGVTWGEMYEEAYSEEDPDAD